MKHWIAVLLLAGAMVGMSGCRSMHFGAGIPRIVISVERSGRLVVGERIVPPGKVAKALRAEGGKPGQTEILLSLADKMTPEDLAPAVAALRKAGYSKVILVRPRKASSSINEPRPRR